MTPYQEAGFNELSLFRVLEDCFGILKDGDICWIAVDDASNCPKFGSRHFKEAWMNLESELAELPKDADGFYLWEGGESPVPGDWEVQVKTRKVPIVADGLTGRADEWSWLNGFNTITAFKPISRPDMPSVAECATEEAEVDDRILETFGPLAESDPHGESPHESGAKLDAGKNRLGLVLGGFSRALQEVGKVGTHGANKYTDNGWIDVPNGHERYTDAMLRHWIEEAAGVSCDKDTNLAHAAHLAWNALARLELALIEAEALESGQWPPPKTAQGAKTPL